MQEQELFQGYEIKNWDISPRIYKILGVSALLNIMAFVIIGQANLLTRKGCESPLVNRVCSVMDVLYVASGLAGTDSEFVSKEYEKTELEDAEITWLDVTGNEPPMTYPAGYFALANPESMMPDVENVTGFENNPGGSIPGIPNPTLNNSGTDLSTVNPTLPQPNNNPVVGTLPGTGNNPTIPKGNRRNPLGNKNPTLNNDSPKTLPNVNGDETANKDKTTEGKKPIESEAVKEVEINKKPFEDLGDALNESVAKNEVDLTKPFSVVLDGVITKEGKLDRTKSRFVKIEGDEKMRAFAQEAIEAVGDSGFLWYLKSQNIDRINLTLVQDNENIYAIIVADQKTPERAATTASGLNTALEAAKFADANNLKKLDERSKILIEKSKISTNGKNFVYNFTIPKADGQILIRKSLQERAEKKNSQPKTSSELNTNSNAVGKK